MRLYCLNGDPNYPCFVLTIKGCTIMLDCSLNMKTLQYFMPKMLVKNQRFESMPQLRAQNGTQIYDNVKEFNNRIFLNSEFEFCLPQFNLINIEDIDIVLISNFNTMLALPYLTKLKHFRATIYCTEPTLHFGRMMMEELTHFIKNNQTIQQEPQQNELKGLKKLTNKFPLFKALENIIYSNQDDENNNDNLHASTSSLSSLQLSPSPLTTIQKDQIETLNTTQFNDEQSSNQTQKKDTTFISWKSNMSQILQLLNCDATLSSHLKLANNWQSLYDKNDVDLCISKIKLINFNEVVSVYGSIKIQAISSGYSIGKLKQKFILNLIFLIFVFKLKCDLFKNCFKLDPYIYLT